MPDAPPPGRAAAAPPQPAAPGGRRERPRAAPPPPPPAPLPTAQAEQLNALRLQAAHAPAGPALDRIDPALIPAPLQALRPNDDCAQLTLSQPAFAGDAAFVELAYACGTVCGNGNLYALQRRDGRWAVVGHRRHLDPMTGSLLSGARMSSACALFMRLVTG